MDAIGQEPEGDGAEQAFAALRDEVAALRRGVELVYRQGQQSAPAAPDYGLTLGQMEKALQDIAGRLEAVERQPALTMTPARFQAEIEAVAQGAVTVVSQPFVKTQHEARVVTRDLEALAGRVRNQREQQQWLVTAGALGVMGGVFLWFMLIVLLPFGAGDRLAALPIGGGEWQAGETLMQEASPASFEKMARLYRACGTQPIALCEAAITVRTIAPGTTAASMSRGGIKR